MGRSLSGAFGAGGVSQGVFNLKAGAPILQNDLLQLGPDGQGYPVKVTDYAAVSNMAYGTAQTSTATGRIVTETTLVSGQTNAYYRQPVMQGVDGNIYTISAQNSSAQGLRLAKYTPAGTLIDAVAIDATTTAWIAHHAFFLSNGNIAVLATTSGGTILSYAIYDTNLVPVKVLTAISEAHYNNTPWFDAVPLSGGGFALVYQQSANPLLSRLVTYDNAGNAVLAPTTIWTRTGINSAQYHKMAQLSNGNLAIVINSQNSTASFGLFHGIVTTAGASVLAFTNLDTLTAGVIPEISVMTGFYAVSRANLTNQTAFVFNNNGALQGSGFSAATVNALNNRTKLLHDGANFWLIWSRSSDTKEVLTKLPTTGTGYATTLITMTIGASNYNLPLDAFYENGYIVAISQVDSAPHIMWVVDTRTSLPVSVQGTNIGSSTGTPDSFSRILPGGDFSFITMYSSVSITSFFVGKYANSSIMGVSQTAAAVGAFAPTATPSGGYICNMLKGTPTKTFDHSTANIYGNKGSMLTYGVTLRGL